MQSANAVGGMAAVTDESELSGEQAAPGGQVIPSGSRGVRGRSEIYQGLILLAEGYIESMPAAERFRILRAKLERMNLDERRFKVITVTSAVPAEGKSDISVNLARALSIDPLGKTLIIDCDLRKPTVHQFFRVPRENGLSDALFHRKISNRYIKSVAPGLDVITAGTQVVDPTEAIEQPDLASFITQLRDYYRYVIIDCPPVLLCPEPIRLTTLSDTTVLVARAWRTNRKLVREASEAIGPQRILGLVLNDGIDVSGGYLDYGYYGYAGKKLDATPRKK